AAAAAAVAACGGGAPPPRHRTVEVDGLHVRLQDEPDHFVEDGELAVARVSENAAEERADHEVADHDGGGEGDEETAASAHGQSIQRAARGRGGGKSAFRGLEAARAAPLGPGPSSRTASSASPPGPRDGPGNASRSRPPSPRARTPRPCPGRIRP